ncbi:sugar nucleotide-binding protein [Streptomyces sp. NPDC050743]|uniref:sugar nucleotide-binding protein n=1 Tax=Streptomyces sp. NPDC050743 TaxID=3365634 RepID=UPI00378C6F0F
MTNGAGSIGSECVRQRLNSDPKARISALDKLTCSGGEERRSPTTAPTAASAGWWPAPAGLLGRPDRRTRRRHRPPIRRQLCRLTDVDGAERAEAAATAMNGTGVRHLAHACADSGAVLPQVSTD